MFPIAKLLFKYPDFYQSAVGIHGKIIETYVKNCIQSDTKLGIHGILIINIQSSLGSHVLVLSCYYNLRAGHLAGHRADSYPQNDPGMGMDYET